MQETNENEYKVKNRHLRVIAVVVTFLLTLFLIAVGMFVLDDKKYNIISLGIMVISALPFLAKFEMRKPMARELVMLAVMIALAVAGRAAFYLIPQFKPTAAIIILAGVAFGGEAGFVCGACSGFISNVFFGQGPWTPWQMFAFGMVGFIAGLLFNKKSVQCKVLLLCIFGGLSTLIIYGLIVDTGSLFLFGVTVTYKTALAVYTAGVPFNAVHAASTVVFLALGAKPILTKIERVKTKYGLNE